MNVWVINQFAGNPESGWGERHYFFSKYWKEKGYNVTIISGSYNHMFHKLPVASENFNFEEYEGIRFCWVKVPKYDPKSISRFWSFFVFALKVYFLPIKNTGKPDIIIVSSMPIFPILAGYWLKIKYHAKALLFEIRDIWPLTLVFLGNVSKNHPAVKFIGWFEKFGYKKADKIVSLLPNAKSHFEEIANAGSKFEYIPNGLDQNVLTKEELPDNIKLAIPKNKFIIGYTGTIGLANALEHLIDAAGMLKDDERFHFVVIGDGYLKEELISKSKSFGNVSFFNKIRKNQVASAIELFDVCFVGRSSSPLFQHGVSANKYFDYMLAAKPILDSNNLIKDPVELSNAGIIVMPDSAVEIMNGVLQLFEMDKKQLKEMGNRGKNYVENNHNIKHLASLYIDIFESFGNRK